MGLENMAIRFGQFRSKLCQNTGNNVKYFPFAALSLYRSLWWRSQSFTLSVLAFECPHLTARGGARQTNNTP